VNAADRARAVLAASRGLGFPVDDIRMAPHPFDPAVLRNEAEPASLGEIADLGRSAKVTAAGLKARLEQAIADLLTALDVTRG
jgi:hypothetical protein